MYYYKIYHAFLTAHEVFLVDYIMDTPFEYRNIFISIK